MLAVARIRISVSTFVAVVGVLLGLAVAVATPAHAATSYTWVGDTTQPKGDGTSWTDKNNWQPNDQAPGPGSSVTISIPDGECDQHITQVPSMSLQSLDVVGKTVANGNVCSVSLDAGGGTGLTVSGSFAMQGSQLNGNLTLGPAAVGDITHLPFGNAPGFVNGIITVQGDLRAHDMQLDGDVDQSLHLGQNGAVHVLPTGTFETGGTTDIYSDCCLGEGQIINEGGQFHVQGTTNLDGAKLDQKGGLLDVDGTDSVLTSDTSENTAEDGASYGGSGTWRLGQKTTSVFTGTQTIGDSFHLVLGGSKTDSTEQLGGTFSLAGKGTFDWAGGTISAGMTVGKGVRLLASGPSAVQDPRVLSGRDTTQSPIRNVEVHNAGAVQLLDKADYVGIDGASVVNTGTVTLGPGASVTGGRIDNLLGSLVTVPLAGASKDHTPVVLTDVAYHDRGTTAVNDKQTLELTGDSSHVELDHDSISNGGRVLVSAPVEINGSASVGAHTAVVLQKRATVQPHAADATLTGAGELDWTGGTVLGRVDLRTKVVVSGTDVKTISDLPHSKPSPVTISGTTTFAPGTHAARNELDMDALASLTLAGTTSIGQDVTFSHGALTNTGELSVAGSSTHPVVVQSADVVNHSSLTVKHGYLRIDGGDFRQTGGQLLLPTSAYLRLTGGGRALVTGGVVTGAGNLDAGLVQSGGVLVPDVPGGYGTLHIAGSWSMGPRATLRVHLAAKHGDAVAVTGAATVKGTIAVVNDPHSTMGAHDRRTIVTAASVHGAGSCTGTTGAGTTGRGARHWVAGAHGRLLYLVSAAGRHTGC